MAITADKVIVELQAKLDRYAADLRRGERQFDGSMRNIQRRAQTTAASVTTSMRSIGGAFAGVSLVALFGRAINAAAEFEESLTKIVTLVGVNKTEVEEWKQAILELSPAVAKSPGELAEALFFISSAGLRGEQALRALAAAAKGSAIGLGDTQVIADAATSAINAYGEANLSADKAVAILAAGVREGKLEAASIAPVLGNLINVSATLGVSFDQVVGTLAAMSVTGTDAASAATSLNAILVTMAKGGTKESTEELERLGLSFAGLRKSVREDGLLATLQLLDNRIGDNEESLARIFPNVRALRGAMNLLGGSAERVQQVMEATASAVGEDLNAAFGETTQTNAFKFRQALTELNTELLNLGGDVLPVVAAAMSTFNAALKTTKGEIGLLTEQVNNFVNNPNLETFLRMMLGDVPTDFLARIRAKNTGKVRTTTVGQQVSGTLPGSAPILPAGGFTVPPAPGQPEGGGGGGLGGVDADYAKLLEKLDKIVAKSKEHIAALQLERETLGQSTFEIVRRRTAFELMNDAVSTGVEITPTLTRQIEELAIQTANHTAALEQEAYALDRANNAAEGVFQATKQGFSDLILGAQSFEEALAGVLKKFAEIAIDNVFTSLFAPNRPGAGTAGGIFGFLGSLFAGGFDGGGQIPSGRVGLTGERGPEFIRGPATITPISRSGGGTNVTVVQQIDARNSDAAAIAGMRAQIARLKPEIVGAARAAVADQAARVPSYLRGGR